MDELGKSLPVSEAAIDSELEGNNGNNSSYLNCNTPLTGTFAYSILQGLFFFILMGAFIAYWLH